MDQMKANLKETEDKSVQGLIHIKKEMVSKIEKIDNEQQATAYDLKSAAP